MQVKERSFLELTDQELSEILRVKEVKFMAPVLPGDQLRFEVDLIAQDDRGAILQGKAFVKDVLVADSFLMLAIVDKIKFRAKYSG